MHIVFFAGELLPTHVKYMNIAVESVCTSSFQSFPKFHLSSYVHGILDQEVSCCLPMLLLKVYVFFISLILY